MDTGRELKEAKRIHEIAREFERLHTIEEIGFPIVAALAAAVSLIIIFGVL